MSTREKRAHQTSRLAKLRKADLGETYAKDIKLSEAGFDNSVVGKRDSRPCSWLPNLSKASLIDQRLHQLQAWVPVRDVVLHSLQHSQGRIVQLDEHAIVYLSKPQELKNFPLLGGYPVDTTDSDSEHNLGTLWNKKFTFASRLLRGVNDCLIGGSVLLGILKPTSFNLLPSCLSLRLLLFQSRLDSIGKSRIPFGLLGLGFRYLSNHPCSNLADLKT
mmetsp:Transcript_4286/g.18287  ORF Transcript_4286/g.18287 Transcript_4286/m.18287 type:complete len:218 (-) Transcript_4286:105-758(-)